MTTESAILFQPSSSSPASTAGIILSHRAWTTPVQGVSLAVELEVIGRDHELAIDVSSSVAGARWRGSFAAAADATWEIPIILGILVVEVANWSARGNVLGFDLVIRLISPKRLPVVVASERLVLSLAREQPAMSASASEVTDGLRMLQTAQPRSKPTVAGRVPLEMVARDYRLAHRDSADPLRVEQVASRLVAPAAAYEANCTIWSAIFYMHLSVRADFGSFEGDAGGLTSPFASGSAGTIYTDNVDRLFHESWRFEFQAVTAYFSIMFFNDGGEFLGHFEGAALGVVQGVGVGTGTWR